MKIQLQNLSTKKGLRYWQVSDASLGLKARWFSGKEWADGSAEEELQREFFDAVRRFREAHAHRDGHKEIDFRSRFNSDL